MDKGFNFDILKEFIRVMKYINIYIWIDKLQLKSIMDFFLQFSVYYDFIIYHKLNCIPAINNCYLPDKEICLFFREKGKTRLGGTVETKNTVYSLPTNKNDKKLYNHPTIKPMEIISNMIFNSSNEGDIVLDPFIGSGTTAVCAQELNRNFIGYEINNGFYKIACDRLNGITANGQMSIFTPGVIDYKLI